MVTTPSNARAVPYSERLKQAEQHRHNALAQLASSRLFSLTSLMGPMNEAPPWPSDAAWLALEWQNRACIVSDGLSDPWIEPDQSPVGLGLEVFVRSPDVQWQAQAPMAVADSWMFPMVAEISHTLASYPRLTEKLCQGQSLSLHFNIDHIKDGRGRVGALLHIPPQYSIGLKTLLGPIKLVAATLLTAQELHWLIGKKEAGRQQLLAELYRQGIGSDSILNRPSVVG